MPIFLDREAISDTPTRTYRYRCLTLPIANRQPEAHGISKLPRSAHKDEIDRDFLSSGSPTETVHPSLTKRTPTPGWLWDSKKTKELKEKEALWENLAYLTDEEKARLQVLREKYDKSEETTKS